MPGTAFAVDIEPMQNLGGAVSFPIQEIIEEASETFVFGTPVQINATDGGVQAWDGSTTTSGIAGISCVNANNLATTGAGAPQGFTPVLGPGSNIGSYSANANQPLAKITPPGVPFTDGRIPFYVAGPGTVFAGAIGSSSGTPASVATSNAQVGVSYGLSADPNNSFWYVDTNKTGGSVVLKVVALDPRQAVGTVGGIVWFVFLPAAIQILA
jgi:hypothetical protein